MPERKAESRALSIAGSDSSAGAGLQVDLKTFSALGVYGLTVITCITAQNTSGVYKICPLPSKLIEDQYMAIFEDIGFDSVKTGLLPSKPVVEKVVKLLEVCDKPIVVDPVYIAGTGFKLASENSYKAIIEKLIPIATVVTPNINEASRIVDFKIESVDDAEKAAKIIASHGPKAVVVKGGHLKEKPVDVVFCNGEIIKLPGSRVEGTFHGAGCCFSAAIVAWLAKGQSLQEAIKKAKNFVENAIIHHHFIGLGVKPVNPTASLYMDAEKWNVIENIKSAVKLLEENPAVSKLIPETASNLVMALSYARGPSEVAGIPGRIVKVQGKVKAFMEPSYGVSRHVAATVLTAMKFNPNIRAGMNIKMDRRILDTCQRFGFKISSYDRRLEPIEVKTREGLTTSWGAEQAIKALGGAVPDIIYHEGDWGKEPMITVLGVDALDVALKIVRIAEALDAHSSVE
ncbi:bifunctional hydroxymethylpyrimidine kinase/phosphomethylpyrimidine kinase [Candidatus Bathyarchaeota archaeon]|nr:bifunctional hydroxymethylpyrimidine kinase/phosphomethylpyrimidine kinase [Candidatus Bathyarchaeota archaeon]MBS7613232.1 bifunctional hydroxymethylpyrimidine kinase/phosphomethylpyrimidine kinase [Candidatus Bathyarchaeota archaeon]